MDVCIDAHQEVEPVDQELTKNDLGRPMQNFASQGSLLVVVGESSFHLIVTTRLRISGHACVPDGAPIKCSEARNAFPNHTPAVRSRFAFRSLRFQAPCRAWLTSPSKRTQSHQVTVSFAYLQGEGCSREVLAHEWTPPRCRLHAALFNIHSRTV